MKRRTKFQGETFRLRCPSTHVNKWSSKEPGAGGPLGSGLSACDIKALTCVLSDPPRSCRFCEDRCVRQLVSINHKESTTVFIASLMQAASQKAFREMNYTVTGLWYVTNDSPGRGKAMKGGKGDVFLKGEGTDGGTGRGPLLGEEDNRGKQQQL